MVERIAEIIVLTEDLRQGARTGELADALLAENQAPREDREMICVLVPRRNVETSVLCLSVEIVDETVNYC